MTDTQAKRYWMQKAADDEWALFLDFTRKYISAVSRNECLVEVTGDIVCGCIGTHNLLEGWLQYQRDREVFPDAVVVLRAIPTWRQ
jgi:hypothetical protein